MKLLTSTALFLLLISLASVSYGQVETVNYPNGGVYVGEVEGGGLTRRPHGLGILTTADGNIYEGNWEYGLQHGMGTHTNPDGVVTFTGEWVHGAARVPLATLREQEREQLERERERLALIAAIHL